MARRLRFYTKEDCPLCDAGWQRLQRPVRWLRIDVERSLEGPAEYRDRLPVVVDDAGQIVLEGRWTERQAWRVLLGGRRRLEG